MHFYVTAVCIIISGSYYILYQWLIYYYLLELTFMPLLLGKSVEIRKRSLPAWISHSKVYNKTISTKQLIPWICKLCVCVLAKSAGKCACWCKRANHRCMGMSDAYYTCTPAGLAYLYVNATEIGRYEKLQDLKIKKNSRAFNRYTNYRQTFGLKCTIYFCPINAKCFYLICQYSTANNE